MLEAATGFLFLLRLTSKKAAREEKLLPTVWKAWLPSLWGIPAAAISFLALVVSLQPLSCYKTRKERHTEEEYS